MPNQPTIRTLTLFFILQGFFSFIQSAGASENLPFYEEAQTEVETERSKTEDPRKVSDIWLLWAGRARDQGFPDSALVFFKRSIEADPVNARAHVLYADYLSGYRGQFELAYSHYRIANDLIKEDKDYFLDPQLSERLDRSLSIFHRDAKDGVEIIKTPDFAFSVRSSAEYGQIAAEEVDFGLIDLVGQERRFTDINFNANEVTDNPGPDRTKIPRRPTQKKGSLYGILRFRNPDLPVLTLSAESTQTDEVTLNFNSPSDSTSERWDFEEVQYRATLSKTTLLTRKLDLTSDGYIGYRRLKIYNPAIESFFSTEQTRQYGGAARLRYNNGFNVASVTFGASFFDIQNTDSGDDGEHRQFLSFRYSMWPDPNAIPESNQVLVGNERFRGRRSTHWEAGISRAEREFKSFGDPNTMPPNNPDLADTTQIRYRPFITYEEFGLLGGYLDLLFKYQYRTEKVISNPSFPRDRLGSRFDTFREHEFLFTPTWVPVYNLYDSHEEFTRGLEHMTVSFPMSARFVDGPYDRIRGGIEIFQRIVGHKVSFSPSIGADYAYYHELERSDWGFFFKISIGSGDPGSTR